MTRGLAVWLVLLFSFPAHALDNQLKQHPSPYLALHGSDPTAWQEWNPQTIERARRENKLLFVSIGYFSCHWCHVMQRESYKNADIAKLLNERFIPVKVDRELNGALDAELQAFAEATRKQAGWPLNVFITPEGYPLYALLYAPPQEFLQTISRLDTRWQQESDKLKQVAQSAAQEMPVAQETEAKFAPQIGQIYRQRLVEDALAQADPFRGGFGTANKFPHAPQLAALLEIQRQAPQPKLGEFLRLTFDQMASLGLYDHVGGGFFRYTTDPDWHIPHFEKMLYDNAQLASLYLQAAKDLKQPAYRDTAHATLDFMLADMWDQTTGAFITSTSAIDTHDREGGVYLWDKAALKKLLTPAEFKLATRYWGLDRPADTRERAVGSKTSSVTSPLPLAPATDSKSMRNGTTSPGSAVCAESVAAVYVVISFPSKPIKSAVTVMWPGSTSSLRSSPTTASCPAYSTRRAEMTWISGRSMTSW